MGSVDYRLLDGFVRAQQEHAFERLREVASDADGRESRIGALGQPRRAEPGERLTRVREELLGVRRPSFGREPLAVLQLDAGEVERQLELT